MKVSIKVLELEYLSKLLPHFKFYNDKKVSNLTLKLYKGGLATAGKLNGRFVFPIFDENDPSQIIGFTGRHLRWKSESEFPKWKHVGRKSNWLYPICISNDTGSFPFLECTQERREIIIVESIGDSLALTENNFLKAIIDSKLKKKINLPKKPKLIQAAKGIHVYPSS